MPADSQNLTPRNKDNSKQQFLNAVAEIMRTKGFSGLKVNDIASVAGLDKKLIYRYFGGKDGLIDEYIRSLDFWSNVKEEDAQIPIIDGGREFSKQMLSTQFDQVNNDELKKIMLWGLTEKRKALTRVADEREAVGEILLSNITDPHFREKAVEFRASMAVLVAGMYYINLYAGVNSKHFCGIDVTQNEGRNHIKKAMQNMIDLLYDDK